MFIFLSIAFGKVFPTLSKPAQLIKKNWVNYSVNRHQSFDKVNGLYFKFLTFMEWKSLLECSFYFAWNYFRKAESRRIELKKRKVWHFFHKNPCWYWFEVFLVVESDMSYWKIIEQKYIWKFFVLRCSIYQPVSYNELK